jgi:hypothetical protein
MLNGAGATAAPPTSAEPPHERAGHADHRALPGGMMIVPLPIGTDRR